MLHLQINPRIPNLLILRQCTVCCTAKHCYIESYCSAFLSFNCLSCANLPQASAA